MKSDLVKPRVHGDTVKRLAYSILRGELTPDQVLPAESKLCATFGISRTALREAIRTLKEKGMLSARPRIGTIVLSERSWNILDADLLAWSMDCRPNPNFALSLVEARQAIEPAAARLAAMRADKDDINRLQAAFSAMTEALSKDNFTAFNKADIEFHVSLLQASGNAVFQQLSHMIRAALSYSFDMTMSRSKEPGASLRMHGEVIEHISLRNPEAAARATQHLLDIAVSDLGISVQGKINSV